MKIIIDKKEIETELTLLKPTDIICFKVRSALNVEQYTRIKDKLKEILDVKNKKVVGTRLQNRFLGCIRRWTH